jgi:hypothetical protein
MTIKKELKRFNVGRFPVRAGWLVLCSRFDDYVRIIEYRNKAKKLINGEFENTLKLKAILNTNFVPRNEKQLDLFFKKKIDMAYYSLIWYVDVYNGGSFDSYIEKVRALRKNYNKFL